MESSIIENINFDSRYNYQLLRNDIIDLDTDRLIISYSILINIIESNCVEKSAYICDVARDLDIAKNIFFEIANGRVDCETLRECTEELLM